MKYFSVFTGVGGFELGLPEDWECVGMSEVDKNAIKVLRYRFPGVKNYGDIEKIEYEKLPDFDVLVGGSPCQDISVAGKRAGLSGLRSRLFFSYVAILKVKKPRYFIFENVKGLLSSNGGWDFVRVLSEFSQAGYDLWWQVLDATQFGIPQHRERVFVLGSLGEQRFRGLYFIGKTDRKNSELQRQYSNTLTKRYRGATATGTYIVEGEFNAPQTKIQNIGQTTKVAVPIQKLEFNTIKQNGRIMKNNGGCAFTLVSGFRQGVYDGIRIRYLTPLEAERLMGWPDNWTKYGIDDKGNTVELSDNARYNLIGNGVVPQIVSELVDKIMIWEEKK